MSEKITLPKWVFEKIHPDCNKFLVVIQPDGSGDVDGCHGDAQGVAKARRLIDAITLIRKPEGTIYAMITVEPVPELVKDDINYEAVGTLNHMAGINAKRRKRNET